MLAPCPRWAVAFVGLGCSLLPLPAAVPAVVSGSFFFAWRGVWGRGREDGLAVLTVGARPAPGRSDDEKTPRSISRGYGRRSGSLSITTLSRWFQMAMLVRGYPEAVNQTANKQTDLPVRIVNFGHRVSPTVAFDRRRRRRHGC